MTYIMHDMTAMQDILLFSLRIMGMDIVTFGLVLIIIVLLGAIAAFYSINQYKRQKNAAMVMEGDKVLIEEIPIAGNSVKRYLVETQEGTAKKIGTSNSVVTKFAKMKDDIVEPYQLWPGCGVLDKWPYDAPPLQQVTVVKYYFNEGDPAPKMSRNLAEWDTDRITRTTTTFSRLSSEQEFAKNMQGQFNGFFEGFIKHAANLQKIGIILILGIVQILLLVAVIYFTYMNGVQVSKFIGG